MKISERITAENWRKESGGCLIYHSIGVYGDIPGDSLFVETPVGTKLAEAIRTLFPERHYGRRLTIVEGFNDHPDTTFEDVMRVLKFADV